MTCLAYWHRDWVNLQLSFAVISLLLVSYYFLVPESPRLLLQNGKSGRAKEILLEMASKNGIYLHDSNSDRGRQFEEHFLALEDIIHKEKEAIVE